MLDENIIGSVDIRDMISFFHNAELSCPACGSLMTREELRTGRGRLDAGDLCSDLRREYISSKEYGEVFPLLYTMTVCNTCYFSIFNFDYNNKFSNKTKANISSKAASKERKKILGILFQKVPDFTQKRDLISGIAIYLLGIASYNQFDTKDSPTLRMAICSIRLAWLSILMEQHGYGEECSSLTKIFYRKSAFLYDRSIELNNTLEEQTEIPAMGPDYDRDYGYDGVIYLSAWLTVHHGDRSNPVKREETLMVQRKNLSKVFGIGKTSQQKPSVLLNVARDTFDILDEELKTIRLS